MVQQPPVLNMATNIPLPSKLEVGGNLPTNWKRFIRSCEIMKLPLEPLKDGDIVRVKPREKDNRWIMAKVEKQVDVRSYQVKKEDGRVFWHNQRHLHRTPEEHSPPEEYSFLSYQMYQLHKPSPDTSTTAESYKKRLDA